MIIIIIMISLIFFLINKNIKDITVRNKILIYMTIAVILQLIWFVLYRINLGYIGREVYYSDAEVYWDATKTLLLGNPIVAYNKTYIYMCYLIQKMSLFSWVGWNNIFNILCIDLSVTMTISIMYKEIKGKKDIDKIVYLIICTLYNPLIIYSLMRNLKDALFLFIITFIGYLLEKNVNKRIINSIPFIIFLFISIPILYNIRPWGFLISIMAFILFMYEKSNRQKVKKSKKRHLLILISIFISFMLAIKIPIINATLNMWVPIVLKSSSGRSVIENLLGIAKLFVGPGPIRSLFGNTYFMFTTTLGNIMSFIGSIIWYLELSILSVGLKKPIQKIKNSNIFVKYMLLTIVLYILIYVMQYGGSTELRFRGILYIIISTIGIGICDTKVDKRNICISGIVFCILLISNLFFI